MSLLAPLRAYRTRQYADRLQGEDEAIWTRLWMDGSPELRAEIARQVAQTTAQPGVASSVPIDDALLISEVVAMNAGALDCEGNALSYRDVQGTVMLRLLPRSRRALATLPEVHSAIRDAATSRAEEAAPELERAVRAYWPDRIKVRTRTRFVFDGITRTPDGVTAADVLILESTGATDRRLLPAEGATGAALRRIGDVFEEFPTVVLALGAKVGREIWVVPQRSRGFEAVGHHL